MAMILRFFRCQGSCIFIPAALQVPIYCGMFWRPLPYRDSCCTVWTSHTWWYGQLLRRSSVASAVPYQLDFCPSASAVQDAGTSWICYIPVHGAEGGWHWQSCSWSLRMQNQSPACLRQWNFPCGRGCSNSQWPASGRVHDKIVTKEVRIYEQKI